MMHFRTNRKKELLAEANAAHERIDKIAKDFFANRDELNKMSEDVIFKLYDAAFTEAELNDAIAFYQTATGQKVASFLPALSSQAQDRFVSVVVPRLQSLIEPVSEEETRKLKRRIADIKKKKP